MQSLFKSRAMQQSSDRDVLFVFAVRRVQRRSALTSQRRFQRRAVSSSPKRAGSSGREISQSKRTVVTFFSSLRASQKRFFLTRSDAVFLCSCLVDAPGITRCPRHPSDDSPSDAGGIDAPGILAVRPFVMCDRS